MREPFTAHSRLLTASKRWRKAQLAYDQAIAQRWKDIATAVSDGFSRDQIAASFGITRQSIDKALSKATRGKEPK